MKKNFAYETYKNVEAPSNYKSKEERLRYTDMLQKRTRDVELPFLLKHLPPHMERVLEIGSGSGRILHALLKKKRAQEVVGLELSPSRVSFGKEWAKEQNFNATHVVGDALVQIPPGPFDAVLCMTSIYPFFDMLRKDGLRKVLRSVSRVLSPGGTLVLESVTFNEEIQRCRLQGGSTQEWEEYRPGDPFRFNLVRYEWDEKRRCLRALSYNVKRNSARIDGPTLKEWHIQTAASLCTLLRQEGYTHIKVYGEFDSSPYKEGVSKRCIITAIL